MRTKKKALIGVLTLVVVAGIAAGLVVLISRGAPKKSAPPAAALDTVVVRRTDLTDSQSFNGTLGYGGIQTVKGSGTGVLTKLPSPGDVAARGAPLYRVNDQPVPVFFGATPLFRKLDHPGITGADVTVVSQNLHALGYATGPVRDVLTPKLLAAVKSWQAHNGLPPTGVLDVGAVLVVAGPVRVNTVTAQLGDPAGGQVLTVTSTAKVITMPVEATEVKAVHAGMAVAVIRPDNRQIPAHVTAVSTDVQGGGADQAADSDQTSGPPKLTVSVLPDHPQDVADLDSAAVQVQVTTQNHPGVLAVPVGALVALREGGYAVQLRSGALEAVHTGMFSQEMVEISGPGITEGMSVVTSS